MTLSNLTVMGKIQRKIKTKARPVGLININRKRIIDGRTEIGNFCSSVSLVIELNTRTEIQSKQATVCYFIYYLNIILARSWLDLRFKKRTRYQSFIAPISINLLVVYRESVNLIGYLTRRLSADSLQLWIANENQLFRTRDACFTPQCTSRAVFETFELPL